MSFLQNMYSFHCCIQISVIVLQQKFSCISTKGTKKNTMQSSFMDIRGLLYLSFFQNQSYYWTHSDSSSSLTQNSIILSNHIVKSFLKKRYSDISKTHCLSLENMTLNQQLNVKGSIVDTNNRLNGIFPFLNSLNCEFSPGYRLIDMFLVIFCFILWIRKAKIIEQHILTNSRDKSSKLWLI